jgi:glycosyltransferase involved in cell wall biosynthesis
MYPEEISAYVLTYNEAPNIARCLEAITWIPKVIVVDSISDDGTQQIASSFPNVKVIERPFDNLCSQHSFATSLVSQSKWVLRLDADWIVSPELKQEILNFDGDSAKAALRVPFRLAIYGQPVSISLYPPIFCLFRPNLAHYIQEGHTERLIPEGEIINAKGFVTHDDRKSVDRYINSQIRYSQPESQRILNSRFSFTNLSQRSILDVCRKVPGLSPLIMMVYLGIVRLGFFRGAVARHYIIQRVLGELVISLRIIDYYVISKAKS